MHVNASFPGEISFLLNDSMPVQLQCIPPEIESIIFCRRLVCADDKKHVFHELQAKHSGLSVMIGDSLSDLGALLAADFGVVLGHSNSLAKLTAASGIIMHPISRGELRVELS